MRARRVAAVLVVLFAVTGCSGVAAEGAGSTSPTPTPSATQVEIVDLASIDEIGGTRWRGVDSDGDAHGFTFAEDGTVEHNSYGHKQTVDWTVEGDTLLFTLQFMPGDPAHITATLDPATQIIVASGADSKSAFTIEMTRAG